MCVTCILIEFARQVHYWASFVLFYFCVRFKKWLPDNVVGRHDTKTTYQVEIRYANNTNETFTFHGPPGEKTAGYMVFRHPAFSSNWQKVIQKTDLQYAHHFTCIVIPSTRSSTSCYSLSYRFIIIEASITLYGSEMLHSSIHPVI
jgi:hypothetical protein